MEIILLTSKLPQICFTPPPILDSRINVLLNTLKSLGLRRYDIRKLLRSEPDILLNTSIKQTIEILNIIGE